MRSSLGWWVLAGCLSLAGCYGSEIDGAAGTRLETTLDPGTVKAGESSEVTCTVYGPAGHVDEYGTRDFSVEPVEGFERDGMTLVPTVAGSYVVHCHAPEFDLYDEQGAVLTVVPAAPVKVTAILDDPVVQVHQSTNVECVAEDEYGNIVTDAATSVVAPDNVTVADHSVSSGVIGKYEILCQVDDAPDVESVPDELEVTAGDPVEVQLMAKPDLCAYEVDQIVTLSWTVWDEFGNEVPDVPGTLSATQTSGIQVTDQEEHRFKFLEEGEYTFVVTLEPPWELLSDDLTLRCDETGPDIKIKWPERGATIEGTGDPLEIVGTVEDALGEVDKLWIDNEEITVSADGTFQVPMIPEWGLNVISARARDDCKKTSKSSPTYHYTSAYTSFVDESAKGIATEDAIELLLGQKFLDDGDHDPAHLNDLATILEVLLTNIDLAGLADGLIPDMSFPVFNFAPLGGLFSLTGDVIIDIEIKEQSDIGPTAVTIDARDGGIDIALTFGNAEELGFSMQLGLNLTFELGLSILGQSFSIEPYAAADTGFSIEQLLILMKLDIHKPPGGDLTFGFQELDFNVVGLDIDLLQDLEIGVVIPTGVPLIGGNSYSFMLSDFVDLSFINDSLDGVIQGLIDGLEGLVTTVLELDFITDMIAPLLDALEIDLPFELPALLNPEADPVTLNIYTKLTSIIFEGDDPATEVDDGGGTIGMGLGIYADKGVTRNPLGAITRQGCLKGYGEDFDYDWSKAVGLAAKMDAVNAAVFGIWWSGYLNGPIDLEGLMGGLGGGGLGGLPISGLEVELDWLLPPIVNDCSKADSIELQIGDLWADLKIEILTISIDALVYIDAGLDVVFLAEPDGLYIMINEITFMDVEIIEMEDVELPLPIDVRDLLENQLGSLLGSFIEGESFGPLAIPELPLDGLIPGLPPGAAIKIVDLGISTQEGYLVVDMDLD